MAFSKINLVPGEWTLIGDGATITFQNVSSKAVYINATAGANTEPADEVGLYYDAGQGELQANTALFTSAGGTFIWAKPVTGSETSIIVET